VGLLNEIGAALHARMALILLGERPGLGSADSLGAYFEFDPRAGRTDAERNCISNIRPAGLPPSEAAARLAGLLIAARTQRTSGITLKETARRAEIPRAQSGANPTTNPTTPP
jgi:ethanolamine ammonia-lyase small subunit